MAKQAQQNQANPMQQNQASSPFTVRVLPLRISLVFGVWPLEFAANMPRASQT
jgi:hypothetical protein